MLFLNWRTNYAEGMPTKEDMASSYQWHMWTTRQAPFNALRSGEHLVLVASWDGGGRLLWEFAATSVAKEQYDSQEQAVSIIATNLRISRDEVLSNAYIDEKPAQGWVLAYRFHPLRPLDLPKPADLKFKQNGYVAITDEDVLAAWGL